MTNRVHREHSAGNAQLSQIVINSVCVYMYVCVCLYSCLSIAKANCSTLFKKAPLPPPPSLPLRSWQWQPFAISTLIEYIKLTWTAIWQPVNVTRWRHTKYNKNNNNNNVSNHLTGVFTYQYSHTATHTQIQIQRHALLCCVVIYFIFCFCFFYLSIVFRRYQTFDSQNKLFLPTCPDNSNNHTRITTTTTLNKKKII